MSATQSWNNGQSDIRIKLLFGNDIRQWRYPINHQYRSLLDFVRISFEIKSFLLQYTDDEVTYNIYIYP